MHGIAVLVERYADPSPERQTELDECLRRNLDNSEADMVVAFGSHPPPAGLADHAKLRLAPTTRRMTFRDFFAHAASSLHGWTCALANADVWFDGTLGAARSLDLAFLALCLSRWDVQPDGSSRHFDRDDSQDAWIFRSPMAVPGADFFLGIPGCDNRVAAEIARTRAVANPSRSIRAHHLHLTGVRRHTDAERLSGDYLRVPVGSLEGLPRAGP